MNIRKGAFLILLLGIGKAGMAQDSTAVWVGKIRAEYARINSLKMRTTKKDAEEQSTEGGEVTRYYDGNVLRKIVAVYYGESGRATCEYYFLNGQLAFAYYVDYNYDKPLSGKVKSKEENRFYFHEHKLFQWIGPDGHIKDKKLYAEKEKEFWEDKDLNSK